MNTPLVTIFTEETESVSPSILVKPGNGSCPGYFRDSEGFDWITLINPETRYGILQSNYSNWGKTEIRDSEIDETLPDDVFAWLSVCWKAATGKMLKKAFAHGGSTSKIGNAGLRLVREHTTVETTYLDQREISSRSASDPVKSGISPVMSTSPKEGENGG